MSIEDSDKEFDYYISRADENYAVGFIEKGNTEVVSIIEQDGYGSKLIRKLPVPDQINGYEYEVRSALAAIEAGQVECPEMPHGETLEIMRQMDECRKQFGLVFPCE